MAESPTKIANGGTSYSSLPTCLENLQEGSLHFVKADLSELVGTPAAANCQIKGGVKKADLENGNALLSKVQQISLEESVADSLPQTVATPKVIFHFARHAEALHNVKALGQDRWDIVDPDLTVEGLAQCENLKRNFERTDKISLVLVSPMRRTLKTCVSAFPQLLQTHQPGRHPVRVIAYPGLKEHGGGATTTGRSLDILKEEMKETPVEWGLMYAGWEHDHTRMTAQRTAREERVKRELYELSQVVVKGGRWQVSPGLGLSFEAYKGIGNVEILVISHSAFLSALLGHQKQLFRKADVKSFEFATMNHSVTEYSVAIDYKKLREYSTLKDNEPGVQANSQMYSPGIEPEGVIPPSCHASEPDDKQLAGELR